MNKLEQASNLYREKNFVEAEILFRELAKEFPDLVDHQHNHGIVLCELGRYAEAEHCFDLGIKQGNAESYICKGNVLRALDRYHEALYHYGQAFLIDANNKHAYSNYGNTLRELGRPDLAVPFLQASQVVDPNFIPAQFNEAVAQLLNGNFAEGWNKYESRWSYEEQRGLKPKFDKPEWDNTQDIKGKTLLIYCEQGFGDTIQFCRYLLPIQQHGAKIILVTRPELVSLFSGSDNMPVFSSLDNLPDFDYHCALLSLPRVFKTTLDNVPKEVQYVHPDQQIVQQWKKQLGPKKKMRVGLCWSGNRGTWINRYKSINLETLLQVVDTQHQYFALHNNITDSERVLLEKHGVEIVDNLLTDFNQTAGLIANLDFVITVDTAVAHLSASMGLPTWIMLPAYGVDWRWLLNRKDSPWYPTARLFRQQNYGDWSNVIKEIKLHQELFKV